MGRKRLTEEPQIVAAIISVIGTIVGTLLISVLLGFMEGRIALGALVAVISFLLLIAIWVLLVIRWGVRLAATAAAVMVIVGSVIFLIVTVARLIPIGVPVSSPVALAPSPTPQSKPALTPTPLPPAFTPSPFTAGPCRIAYEQDGDIYVKNCDGSGVQRVTDHPAMDRDPAWSPDGQRIVFSSERDRQPTPGYTPGSLYIVNADGSNLTRLTFEDWANDIMPDWSPDGNRIAFHRNGMLAMVNADGSNLREILQESEELSVANIAWSPDGQRLAFANGRAEGKAGGYWTVHVVNADGTGLLELKGFEARYVRAVWSPDGSQVGLEVTYDAGTKYYLMKADGSGEPVEVASISESWHPWHWPKWGGEEKKPSASTAEEARAFAEPILAAIARREPTWSDDFSDPKTGWPTRSSGQGETSYENGEYFIVTNPHPSWPEECCQCIDAPHKAVKFSDFVLEMDLRFISGALSGDPGHWDVCFRESYQAQLRPDSFSLVKVMEGGEGTTLAEHHGAPLKAVEETNHLQIIAKGPQIAFYLNGEPVGLVYDESFSKGDIGLLVCTHTDQPLRVHFDNLKVWDISGLSP